MSTDPLRLRELLERLIEAEVRFVLIGGLAVNAWGYVRGTGDVDVVPDPSRENLTRLDEVAALELAPLKVLSDLPQTPRYVELAAQARDVDLDELTVRVCSLEHLLAMKRASDRARDRDDLEALEAIQEPDQDRD